MLLCLVQVNIFNESANMAYNLFFSVANDWIVLGNGELAIHHSPNGINFRGNEPIDSSELPNILATANGLSSNMVNICSSE